MLLHEFNWKREALQAGEPVLVDFCTPERGTFMGKRRLPPKVPFLPCVFSTVGA
jgi:hypothetical protein